MTEAPLRPVDPTPDEVQYLEDRIYEFNSGATGIDLFPPYSAEKNAELKLWFE